MNVTYFITIPTCGLQVSIRRTGETGDTLPPKCGKQAHLETYTISRNPPASDPAGCPQPHESFPWLSRAFLPSGHPCHFKEGNGYWSLHISQRRALCLICHLCLRMIEFIRFFPESRYEWIRQHMSLGAVRKQARTGWMWGVIKNIFPLIRIPLKIDIPKQWRRKTKYTSWGKKTNKT